MSEPYQLFVGIDWATEFHQVCVINADRQILEQAAFEHSGSGLAQLVEMLLERSDNHPDQVAISIELPRGAVVESLVERQFAVFSLNPKQMDRLPGSPYRAGSERRFTRCLCHG